jgi:hypothetical protein
VLEDERPVVEPTPLEQELEPSQLAEERLQRRVVAPHQPEEPGRDLAPEYRRCLEQAPGILGKPVDAGRQHVLDRRGDLLGREVGMIEERPRQLFDEERIAFRLVEDRPRHRLRDRPVTEERADDRQAVLPRQRAQRDLGGVGLRDPRRAIARPIRHDEEDRHAGQTLDE